MKEHQVFESKTESRKGVPPEAERFFRDKLLKKFDNPSFLPQRKEIEKALLGLPHCSEGSTSERDEWVNFLRARGIFEIWTQEYIELFGKYLADRIQVYKKDNKDPVTILEVGAGDGKLTHYLRKSLDRFAPGSFQIHATDVGREEGMHDEYQVLRTFPIEEIDNKRAIKKYQPAIVIFSWMPTNTDYTHEFREADCVQEYILIGLRDEEAMGYDWDMENFRTGSEEETPQYILDGFERISLDALSEIQFSRTNVIYNQSETITVSFQRKETK